MEIRSNQIMDELFWSECDTSTAVQCVTMREMDYTMLPK